MGGSKAFELTAEFTFPELKSAVVFSSVTLAVEPVTAAEAAGAAAAAEAAATEAARTAAAGAEAANIWRRSRE